MLTVDDFNDIIHANTESVLINGKQEIVLRDDKFDEVVEKILQRMMNNLGVAAEN